MAEPPDTDTSSRHSVWHSCPQALYSPSHAINRSESHAKPDTHSSKDHGQPANSVTATTKISVARRGRHRNRPPSGLIISASLHIILLLLAFVSLASSHVLPLSSTRGVQPVSHGLSRNGSTDTSIPYADGASLKASQPDLSYYSQSTDTAATWLWKRQEASSSSSAPRSEKTCACGGESVPTGRKVGFGILVPILVILSGIFAGLTLGYMSLDETQLQVLMTTGTDIQKKRAAKILPIRKDGHLLLTTLLIANMITNETLPIIFDPLLASSGAGGAVSVVVSTVLIVIFAELIPQSTCSRYGLQIGAFMAPITCVIIFVLYPIGWPVSRILHWVLGPHHGIVYRRAELKELVTMHAATGGRGGDLKGDTVMIVGGALDLQEKVVKQAMTPIDQVFMLPFSAVLDYPTLERIVRSGHSRIPIYQEVEVAKQSSRSGAATPRRKMGLLSGLSRKSTLDGKESPAQTPSVDDGGSTKVTRKKIVGTLLVKSCVLLDPEDAVPVSSMVINALPSVPWDEPLLNVLNAFQEGRSHMAIISSQSRRMLMSESVADLGSKTNSKRDWSSSRIGGTGAPRIDGLGNIDEEKNIDNPGAERRNSQSTDGDSTTQGSGESPHFKSSWRSKLRFARDHKEQHVPADATIDEKTARGKANDPNILRKIDSRLSMPPDATENDNVPLGIITLEDVLEELLGEEILDEYDDRGDDQDFRNLIPPPSPEHDAKKSLKDEQPGPKSEQPHVLSEAEADRTNAVYRRPEVSSSFASMPSAAKKALRHFGLGSRQRDSSDVEVSSPVAPDSDAQIRDSSPGMRADDCQQQEGRSDHIDAVSADHSTAQEGRRDPQRAFSMPPAPDAPAPQTSSQQAQQTPSANRPLLLVRTKGPDGAEKTTLASESQLRGRLVVSPTQGGSSAAPVGVLSSTTAAGNQQNSRSQTPVGGSRGTRFKSQAVTGDSSPSSSGDAYVSRPMASQRSRSHGGDAPSSRLRESSLPTPSSIGDDVDDDATLAGTLPLRRDNSSALPTRSSSPEPMSAGDEQADAEQGREGKRSV